MNNLNYNHIIKNISKYIHKIYKPIYKKKGKWSLIHILLAKGMKLLKYNRFALSLNLASEYNNYSVTSEFKHGIIHFSIGNDTLHGTVNKSYLFCVKC